MTKRIFAAQTVDCIHIGGVDVRCRKVHGAAASLIRQTRHTHEIQQLAVAGFVALKERSDEIWRVEIPSIGSRNDVRARIEHNHQRITGYFAVGVLPAYHVTGAKSLTLLRVGCEPYFEFRVIV